MLILTRFLHFAALMPLFGALLFPFYSGVVQAVSPRLFKLLAALGFITGLVWLMVQAGLMSGQPAAMFDPATIKSVLWETDFGHVWIWHLCFIFLLWITLLAKAPPRFILAVSIATIISMALTGHAVMEEGMMGWLHRINQVFHLLAGSAWLGGLLALVMAGAARRRADSDEKLVRSMLLCFSTAGYVFVATILVTGFFNMAMLVGSLHGLFHSAYGQTLLLKLVFVAAMVMLACSNRFILWRYREQTPLLLLRRNVFMEQCLGFVVLAVVSLLGLLPPPG